MDGYIKIHRKILDWQWFKDTNTFMLFLFLLLDANYEDSKVGFLIIKRGQCLTSLKRINENTGLSIKEIRTSLNKLEKSGEIGKQTTNRYSIITIKNYNDYQDMGKQRANKGQTKGNIKEYKEEKEINNIKENIKRKYGIFENVLLSNDEYLKLKERFTDYQGKIDSLSSYIASKGDKYKSHYATILNWARQDSKQTNIPGWFSQKVQKGHMTKEQQEEINKLLNS